jgi:salicylate hydroxylase
MLQAKLSKNCTIHTSKHLARYEPENTGSITLHFADGSVAHADVLVGADGIHSATRATLFRTLAANANPSKAEVYRDYINPKWSGTLGYRCQVQIDKFKEKYPDHQALSKPKIVCTRCITATNPLTFWFVVEGSGVERIRLFLIEHCRQLG